MATEKEATDKYDNIYWSPYAAYYLNLILKDISSMPLVQSLVSRVLKVIVFCLVEKNTWLKGDCASTTNLFYNYFPYT